MDSIATSNADRAKISEKEAALLEYIKILTLEPAKVRDTDMEKLREIGWTDPELFEASFVASLFAFFNRMADAYGLDYSPNGWIPPELRSS